MRACTPEEVNTVKHEIHALSRVPPASIDGMDEFVRFSALVSGRVQGVGMRRYVQRRAQDLGLSGYAENLSDGRLEVIAEGSRDDLELLLVRIRMGSSHAEVTDIEVNWTEGTNLKGFHVY